MSGEKLAAASDVAGRARACTAGCPRTVTGPGLGPGLNGVNPPGFDCSGVELFCAGDEVWFSEVSPRPHDTGLVTLTTQWQSGFEPGNRAGDFSGLPVDTRLRNAGASAVIYGGFDAAAIEFSAGSDQALSVPGSHPRLFGKPESFIKRRTWGVALAHGPDTETAPPLRNNRPHRSSRRRPPRARCPRGGDQRHRRKLSDLGCRCPLNAGWSPRRWNWAVVHTVCPEARSPLAQEIFLTVDFPDVHRRHGSLRCYLPRNSPSTRPAERQGPSPGTLTSVFTTYCSDAGDHPAIRLPSGILPSNRPHCA
jgi:hypothetical protein